MRISESAPEIESLAPDRHHMLSLRDLFQSMSAISSVTGLHELLPHLARILASSVGSQRCAVYLYDADLTRVVDHLRWGYTPEELEILTADNDLAGPRAYGAERHVLDTRRTLVRIPGETPEELLPISSKWRELWRGDMVAPLIWNDRIEGVAFVRLPDGAERFDPLQAEIIQGVAQQAAGIINHLRASEAQRDARAQMEMLLELSRVFSSAGSISEIYPALAEAVRSTLEADATTIIVYEESLLPDRPTIIRRVAARGMTDVETAVRDKLLNDRRSLGSTIDRIALERREPVIIDSLDRHVDDERLSLHMREQGVTALVAAPIIIGDELHGMLYSWSREGGSIHGGRLDVVGTMTRYAAASIERLSLIDVERRQRHLTEALADVSRQFARTGDPALLIQIATGAVRETLGADLAATFTTGDDVDELACVVADGASGDDIACLARASAGVLGRLAAGDVPDAGTRVLGADQLDSTFSLAGEGTQPASWIGGASTVELPLRLRGRTLGVCYAWFQGAAVRVLEKDLDTVERIFIDLAMALERVALQASERREWTRAETLLSFADALNRSVDLDTVRRSILQVIMQQLPGAHVAIALVEGDVLHEWDVVPDVPFAAADALRQLLEDGLESRSEIVRQIDDFSVFATPLTAGEDLLGMLIVSQSGPDAISPARQSLVAAICPQAADAIQRARLFALSERTIAELTLLHEIGRTIAQRHHLSEIFDHIAVEIRELVNYSAGFIALESERPGYLETVSVWGDVRRDSLGLEIPVNSSIIGTVFRTHEPVIVDDVDRHATAWGKDRATWRSLICVPLMTGNRCIGAMLLGHADTEVFTREDVRLASLVAGQAGAAIYQAREAERQRVLYRAGVEALAAAVDAKDSYIHSHSRHVAELSRRMAEALGLDAEEVERIELAGLLHDVGKIGIPDHILTKSGRLDAQERLIMISHATLGSRIVAAHPSLAVMARLVHHHHEWHNGSGYPDGLRGDEVPIGSAIIAVADAFDSMTSYRPYRSPLTYDEACEELKRWSGTQFHPRVVDAFLSVITADALAEASTLPGPSMNLEPIRAVDIIAPRVLSQIAAEIGGLTDLYPFLDRLQQIIREELKYEEVHIFLKDESSEQLFLAASATHAELVNRLWISSGDGIAGQAALTRTLVNCADVLDDPRAHFTNLGTRSVLAAPLVVDGMLIGVLGAGSAEPGRFEERDEALIDAIARQIAPAVLVSHLHDHAQRAASIDGLTGVMNHRAFYLRLESMIAELDHWDNDLHLLVVDVIGLKAINDVHGHLAGDRALIAIANALKSRVRGEDEIARYGGDEFVVIVRGTPRAGLAGLVERITAPVEFVLDSGYEMTVRLRCGVATASSATERATELVARADAGLYSHVQPTERDVDF